MKILIISDLAPPYMGGGETYVIQLGTHLTKLGHEVHWLTSRIPGTEEYENYQDIHIHRIPILFSKQFVFPGRQTFPLMSTIRKLDFVKDMDVVQANTLVAGYSGWRIAKKYSKPSLLFCHELLGDLWKKIGQNVLERKIYPEMERRIARSHYDWYACPSEYSKSTLINAGAPKERITVIPHGINHEMYNVNVDDTYFRRKFKLEKNRLFGYLGRLRIKKTAQSKNLTMLLDAARIVVKEIPNSRLVLAGAGYEELEPVVRNMELEKYVIYIGDIPYENNPKFLRMCDVVVCPALADGFCFLLAEAAACGRSTVATKVGAHIDRVLQGETGLLTALTAEGLASAIIEILSKEQLTMRFGKKGRHFAEQFRWKESTKRHVEIYEMLLTK